MDNGWKDNLPDGCIHYQSMTLRFVTKLEKTHANADALLRIDYETNKEYSKSERRPVELITIATNLTYF